MNFASLCICVSIFMGFFLLLLQSLFFLLLLLLLLPLLLSLPLLLQKTFQFLFQLSTFFFPLPGPLRPPLWPRGRSLLRLPPKVLLSVGRGGGGGRPTLRLLLPPPGGAAGEDGTAPNHGGVRTVLLRPGGDILPREEAEHQEVQGEVKNNLFLIYVGKYEKRVFLSLG